MTKNLQNKFIKYHSIPLLQFQISDRNLLGCSQKKIVIEPMSFGRNLCIYFHTIGILFISHLYVSSLFFIICNVHFHPAAKRFKFLRKSYIRFGLWAFIFRRCMIICVEKTRNIGTIRGVYFISITSHFILSWPTVVSMTINLI